MRKKLSVYYSFWKQYYFWKSIRRKIKVHKHQERNVEPRIVIVPCDPETVGGSRGDEAMIMATIQYYRRRNPSVDISIVVSDRLGEEYVASIPMSGIHFICSWNGNYSLERVYTSILAARPSEVVILGADCMDGYYSPYLSLVLLSIYDLLCANGISSHLLGFSFNAHPSKMMLRAFSSLEKSVKIRLRDAVSLERYKKYTFQSAELVADAAFLLCPDKKFDGYIRLHDWVTSKRAEEYSEVIGFNFHPMLRQYENAQGVEKDALILARNIEKILIAFPHIVFVLIPHDNRSRISDNLMLQTIFDYLSLKGYVYRIYYDKEVYHASQLKAICALLDGLISSRMHLAIAALGQKVPVMAATYQDKFEGLFQHFGLANTYLLSPEQFTSEHMVIVFGLFVKELHSIKNCIHARLPQVLELSENNLL